MTPPRYGSLCTGYGGLDMAVQSVFGGSVAWHADIDPGASAILAHRYPRIPNLGDLTTTDWAAVEPVEVVAGGYPCQPFSVAGLQKGTADERHIWPYIATALRVLRPRYAIFENVAGHLRLGFDAVLADLAGLGFDAEWCVAGASEVGAPHQRKRLFILATAQDADRELGDQRRLAAPGQTQGGGARPDAGGRGGAPAAHADSTGLEVRRVEPDGPELPTAERGRGESAADADGCRRWGGQGLVRGIRPEERVQGHQPPRDWGKYGSAVHRWEGVCGRPAPWATDDRNRLSPLFVEWLMGLPAGHVTDVPGLTRSQQLKALGNGVVPQQAEAALRLLFDRADSVPGSAARRSLAAPQAPVQAAA